MHVCGYIAFGCCSEGVSTRLRASWWRHQMETFSALLALCAGNSPVPGEFPAQRPVTRSFDVFFDLRPNKRLSKHSRGWWFETLSSPLWRHRNDKTYFQSAPFLLQVSADIKNRFPLHNYVCTPPNQTVHIINLNGNSTVQNRHRYHQIWSQIVSKLRS